MVGAKQNSLKAGKNIMSFNTRLSDCQQRLSKANGKSHRFSLIYQWIKQDYILEDHIEPLIFFINELNLHEIGESPNE